ncbi:MAG TPA: protein kinase [Thermoanaerobaculia bacterium]|jgi:tetratricopeptide (TPR) repeat protein
MSSSQPLGSWVIGERVSTSVWLAEDTRNGKQVAVKLLTKQLPKEQAKRDTMVRDVRIAAALYHAFLIPILEITPVGDNLLMVMELVDAQPVARRAAGGALPKSEVLRIGYQLASVVKYLHMKGLLHGNVAGDSVLVTPAGQVQLAGFNIANLLRRERTSAAYQQKGSDARAVAYLAPEQIANQTIDEKTDLFSTGVVLYELATGKLPFNGATAPDVARAIVEGNPASPKALNPQIDNALVSLLGGCLFKDPFKRQRDAKALVEQIERIEPDVIPFAASLEKKIATPVASISEHRRSILLVAEVANDETVVEDASKAAARMQQILGEAVYLFDGHVIDPFGARLVAELPTVDNALEAGRKAEFDLQQLQAENDPLQVRMLLHAGELEVCDGVPAGPAVEKAVATLAEIAPNALFITEDFVKGGRGNVRLRDAGARAGVKLFTIVPPEPPPVMADLSPEPNTAELEAELAVSVEVEAIAAAAARKKKAFYRLVAAAVVLGLFAGAGAMWMRGGEEPAPVVKKAAPVDARPTAANPRAVHLTVAAADPTAADLANTVRLGTVELLRAYPELRVVDAPAAGAASVGATIAPGADAGAEILRLHDQAVRQTRASRRLDSPAGLTEFANAVVARSLNDTAAVETSLRAAIAANPNLLPAQVMAMDVFKDAEGLAAARQVLALDPANLGAARKVARASMVTGDLAESLAAWGLVLRREPRDAEALNHVARYALSSGDTAKFNQTIARMKTLPPAQVSVHEPDALAAAGRIDGAIQRYYTVEETQANNAPLALKIGRLSVLRHSLPIAELELKKLAVQDPLYGYQMLSAYIAAEKKDRAGAMQALERALRSAEPGDDSWTSAAEVHAILDDTTAVMQSLEKAAARNEPTAAYVLANPLFRYLHSDPRFVKVRATLTAQQAEIRGALAALR